MNERELIEAMDQILESNLEHIDYFNEDLTLGKAKMFVLQHRLNSRYRNSTLKLKVATNCPVYEIKIGILEACSEEILGDYKYFQGKPHWKVLEELGGVIGLGQKEIQEEKPLKTTKSAWMMFEGLMANTHWVLGLLGNTCMERGFISGYGKKIFSNKGVAEFEYERWRRVLSLKPEELKFFTVHSKADLEHSELGWKNIAIYAKKYGLENDVLSYLDMNLQAWKIYYDGINKAGKKLDNKELPEYSI